MIFTIKLKRLLAFLITFLIVICIVIVIIIKTTSYATASEESEADYIKWVDFSVTSSAMDKAYKIDVESHNSEKDTYKNTYNWIEILSYLAAKYGGDFSRYREKDINNLITELESGKTLEDITKDMKYYSYYLEAYGAILAEYVGSYSIEQENDNGEIQFVEKYGLKVFSPIAKGYSYNHFDDFGSSRAYGYDRKHLGHDLMGNVGTPIIAIESGIIEELGWNQYGGWRIGIRSYDGRRYYYYAHLRKDQPYAENLYEGMEISAGDVIGYMGRTGYSSTENVNNINTTHLHFGIQLIFDKSQKDGINQIWIDCYQLTKFLEKNKSKVQKVEGTKEYIRVYDFKETLNTPIWVRNVFEEGRK